jgi:hypothetical protein
MAWALWELSREESSMLASLREDQGADSNL